jgi:hypothetical protein
LRKASSACNPSRWRESRSLQALAKRDGITGRYVRRLVGFAFLSPQLVEEILQGRQLVEFTTTRLTGLDLSPPILWGDRPAGGAKGIGTLGPTRDQLALNVAGN